MAQARLQGSGVKTFDNDDFESATRVDYIASGKTAADSNEEPIVGTLEFTGNAVPSQVEYGTTFYNNDIYTLKTGTLSFASASGTQEQDVEKGKIVYNNSLHTPITGTLEFTGNAVPSNVEKNYTFYNNDLHTKRTGTLAFNGTATNDDVEKNVTYYNTALRTKQTGTLEFTGSTVPSQVENGYTFYNTDLHTKQTGTLDLSSSTASGNALPTNILNGKTAHVTDIRNTISGTMRNNGAVVSYLNSGGSYSIPSGYHDGNGKIVENSPKDQTAISSSGAGAGQIWSGKTLYVNGNLITGTGSAANTNGVSGYGIDGSVWNSGGMVINWTYPATGWYSGVCILGCVGTTAPESSTPSTHKYKLYMGAGTKTGTGSYSVTLNGLAGKARYSFSIYPYVVVDGITYWYGNPTPRKLNDYRTGCNGKCSCNNKDCDGECSHDGECCHGACSF